MNDTLIWIIVAAVVVIALVVIIALVVSNGKKKANRERAQNMRVEAQQREDEVRREEARAAETEAAARKARAEADEKAARAERLEMDAQGTSQTAGHLRHEQVEQQRQADRLDPDVKTDRHGERLDDEHVWDDRAHDDRTETGPLTDDRITGHDADAPDAPQPQQPPVPVEDQSAVPLDHHDPRDVQDPPAAPRH